MLIQYHASAQNVCIGVVHLLSRSCCLFPTDSRAETASQNCYDSGRFQIDLSAPFTIFEEPLS